MKRTLLSTLVTMLLSASTLGIKFNVGCNDSGHYGISLLADAAT